MDPTSTLSQSLNHDVLECVRAFHREAFHEARASLYFLAQDTKHVVPILTKLRELAVAPTLREDFIVLAAQHAPHTILDLLMVDAPAAALAMNHCELRNMPGGADALVAWVSTQPQEMQADYRATLMKWAIQDLLEEKGKKGLPLLTLLTQDGNVADLPMKAMKSDQPSVLHHVLSLASKNPGVDLERAQRVVGLLLEGGADLEAKRHEKTLMLAANVNTPLQYGCYVRDGMEQLDRTSDTLDHMIQALLSAGADWTGCDQGDTASAKLVRGHAAWRKEHLLNHVVPQATGTTKTRKNTL